MFNKWVILTMKIEWGNKVYVILFILKDILDNNNVLKSMFSK